MWTRFEVPQNRDLVGGIVVVVMNFRCSKWREFLDWPSDCRLLDSDPSLVLK
jgi:hypothetical protein